MGGMYFDWLEFWRRRKAANVLLLPLSWVFLLVVTARRLCYRVGFWFASVLFSRRAGRRESSVPPVVVVGNLTVGGGGKTPLVIALVAALRARGYTPGVVSRGYGGRGRAARAVGADSDWRDVGDEAVMIARETGAPMWVGARRRAAVRRLAAAAPACDVIISDDGLQHYAMARAVDVVVVKESYGFGNGWMLPAGPLREPISRLTAAAGLPPPLIANYKVQVAAGEESPKFPPAHNQVMPGSTCAAAADKKPRSSAPAHNQVMQGSTRAAAAASGRCPPNYVGGFWCDGVEVGVGFLLGKVVAAVAGVARAEEFFLMAEACGVVIARRYPLADHGFLSAAALAAIDADVILMTQKDAVKYSPSSRIVVMRLRAVVSAALVDAIIDRIDGS